MSQEAVLLIIAVTASGLFIVQFLMSLFGADFGMDLDTDADVSFDFGSVISFKGLLHFLIGFGWYMYFCTDRTPLQYLIGVLVGLVFVVVLWYLYRFAWKLQQENKVEENSALVGRNGTIYLNKGGGNYLVQIEINGALREHTVVSFDKNTYATGTNVIIWKCENGILYIH